MEDNTIPTITDYAGLMQRVSELEQRVSVLEGAQAVLTPEDELTVRILNYMRKYPDMKWMANSLAINLGEDNSRVGTRLKSMVNKGLVERSKDDGKVSVYSLKVVEETS